MCDLVVAAPDHVASGIVHRPSLHGRLGRPPLAFRAVTSPLETCDECGFDGRAWTEAEALREISDLPRRYSDAVAGLQDVDLQRRPIAAMWSIAEYVDHVREVLFGMRFLLDSALETPGTDLGSAPVPSFEPEPRAVDIDAALAGVAAEADRLSRALGATPPDVWMSHVIVDGDELDVHWIARHAVHDPTHHLADVVRLRAAL